MREEPAAVRIQREDFLLDRELESVKKSSSSIGGAVLFLGVVRDFSQGQEVEKLHFEYYPAMAERELGKLREEAMERFGLIDLRIVHRHGELFPGDNIVLIAASAMHRKGAFEAAAWCIERLKERVPVWKKEFTAAGEVWVEGTGRPAEGAGE